jgi:hypothetical protein
MRDASRGHLHGALNLASCRAESDERRVNRRRVCSARRDEPDERCGHPRRAHFAMRDETVERRVNRRRVCSARRDEPDERCVYLHRARSESLDAPCAEADRSRIRLERPCDVERDRRVPSRSSGALRDRCPVPEPRIGSWIVPDEERSFDRERAVRHSRRGADRSLRDVPEGFGEKEESKRPRASLHVGQNPPDLASRACSFVSTATCSHGTSSRSLFTPHSTF